MGECLFRLTETEQETTLKITGSIGEGADFAGIPLMGMSRALVVDFDQVSCFDAREMWERWIESLGDVAFIFKNIRPCVAQTFNLWPASLPAKYQVESFFLPYRCPHCGNRFERLLVRNNDYFAFESLPNFRHTACESCQQMANVAVEYATYFTFLEEADLNRYAFFNVFQEAIMVIDENNVIKYANDFVSQILQVSVYRLISKGLKINEVFDFAEEGLFSTDKKTEEVSDNTKIVESKYQTKKGREGALQVCTLPDAKSPSNRPRWIVYMHDTSLEILLRNKYRNEQEEKKQKTVELTKSKQEKEEIYKKATTDELTGLKNYRAFIERCKLELEKCKRNQDRLGLVILDIDLFKKFNDTYGHQQGDEVLRTVGRALSEVIRASDFVGRYGGEEFVMIFPQTDIDGLSHIMEKARENLASKRVPMLINPEKPPLSVTATFGGICIDGKQLENMAFSEKDLQRLIDAADQNLYEGKGKGRNRSICTYWVK